MSTRQTRPGSAFKKTMFGIRARAIRGLIMCGALILCAGHALSASAQQIQHWYEDNNRGFNKGYPLDFISRYDSENIPSWAESRSKMQVWSVANAGIYEYCKADPNFGATIGTVLDGTPTCFDTVAATWAHHLEHDLSHKPSINAITRMKDWGWNPQYIALQSVLSKPYPKGGGWNMYQVPERVLDVVTFFQALRSSRHSEIKIGIIDAMPAHAGKDFETVYDMLADGLAAEGFVLDFILLDFPNCHPDTTNRNWGHLLQAENKAKALGWKTGWFMSSKTGGQTNGEQYRSRILKGLKDYLAFGGKPDFVLTGAFAPYPEWSAPDDVNTNSNPNGATQLGTFLLVDDVLNKATGTSTAISLH